MILPDMSENGLYGNSFIYLIQNLLIFTEPNERLRDFCIKRKYHPTQIKAHSETAWAALFSQTWN